MKRKAGRKQDRKLRRLGKLPPQYQFLLNPFTNVRFTASCPGCDGKTKQRKFPLAIHVDNCGLVILNKTCRFCPHCDLVIAHQNEIEAQLAHVLQQATPPAVLSDYLIIGTVERKDWRRGLTDPLSNQETIDALHDFKNQLQFKPAPVWEFGAKPP